MQGLKSARRKTQFGQNAREHLVMLENDETHSLSRTPLAENVQNADKPVFLLRTARQQLILVTYNVPPKSWLFTVMMMEPQLQEYKEDRTVDNSSLLPARILVSLQGRQVREPMLAGKCSRAIQTDFAKKKPLLAL